MNCPRCDQPVEAAAAFCGNCGQALQKAAAAPVSVPAPPSPVAQILSNTEPSASPANPIPLPPNPAAASQSTTIPAYAVPNPAQHKAETNAMIGLLLSVLALPAAIIPLFGMPLAVISLVLATNARPALPRKTMSNAAIALACLAIVLSVGAFIVNRNAYLEQQDAKTVGAPAIVGDEQDSEAAATGTEALETPCFKVGLPELKSVDYSPSSCDVEAYNANTIGTSTTVYYVSGAKESSITESNLAETGKEVADTYLKSSLPDFVITSQQVGKFAKGPAYIINAKDDRRGVAMQMVIALHTVSHGENVFIIMHAAQGDKADVTVLESSWEWKK